MNYRKWDKFEGDSDEDPMTAAATATRSHSRVLPQLRDRTIVRKTPEPAAAKAVATPQKKQHIIDVIGDLN